MLSSLFFRKGLIIFLLIGVSLFLQSGLTSAANGSNGNDEGVEVLMRGPIHEAFAEVSVDETQQEAVTSRSVPDPINEIPPDFRPEGDQIEWIPGYWSWDEDQDDFIWVSGVWRDVPPGRQWIPGYWMSVEGGNQYISGFWTDTNQKETIYLPPPPKPLEAGPSSPAMTPNHGWVDGNWVWHHDRYAWRAGYWVEQSPDMVWVPAHYVWSPRGYIFIMGYWDYQLPHRGVMFAPLYYKQPTYRNHGYYYTPSIVLNIDAIFLSLFIRRGSHHYYFGDYHDHRYEKRGFYPWYSKHATRYGYDPYYRSYRSYQLRHDGNWEKNYHQQFQYRRDHKEARPQQNYRLQPEHNFDQSRGLKNHMIGRRLTDVVKQKDQPVQFKRLKPDQKKEFQSQDQKLKKLQVERRKVERAPVKEGKSWKPTDIKKPVRLKMPVSPIKANPERRPVFERSKGKPQENQRVKPQDQTENRPQAEQPERQRLKRQEQPQKQHQDKPQRKKQLNPQDQIKEQPPANE
ncbi:MAG: hypothetical protein KKF12_05970 [Proteobacteria bacterium]|nr:hypothetical protein [Desulfobacula sp.]MBU4130347.1 hypothetical protein [Pseudomonadota bacterium]